MDKKNPQTRNKEYVVFTLGMLKKRKHIQNKSPDTTVEEGLL